MLTMIQQSLQTALPRSLSSIKALIIVTSLEAEGKAIHILTKH